MTGESPIIPRDRMDGERAENGFKWCGESAVLLTIAVGRRKHLDRESSLRFIFPGQVEITGM